MRALLYDGQLRVVEDHARPSPPVGEALIKVRLSGICNTDMEIVRGYMGFRGVLGHEFVGIVEQCADPELVGQRVVGEINCSCDKCDTCLAGNPTHCPNRTTLGISGRDGTMADYCVLPMRNLHVVPPSVTDEQAVFVEPLAAAVEIAEQVHVRPTQRVVVVGDGKLGLLVAQVLRLTGCDLVAIGRHPQKLAILERLGIDTRIASEPPSDIRYDVVVECTGKPGGFQSARAMVKPRGTLVLKSTFVGQSEVNLTSVVVDEVSLVGSRCGPFAPALRLLAMGLIDVEPLISAILPLGEALSAFQLARTAGTIKVLLRP